jgi:ankyrin repeat protein
MGLQNPDRVNERNEEGQTPLMIAIYCSNWKLAKYFIDDAGANLELLSPDSLSIYTLLKITSDHRSTESLELKKKLQVLTFTCTNTLPK